MTAPLPTLPEPLYGEVDSMLSRKFGREVANYFSSSPLNRVSFLRSESAFLSSAFLHPTTRFILFRNLQPLTSNPSTLIYARRSTITPLVGENPFTKSEEQMIEEYNSSVTVPQMIFLGLDEREKRSDGSGDEDGEGLTWKEVYKGRPVFAVDVTPKGSGKEEAEKLGKELEDSGLQFFPGRMPLGLPAKDAAVYAQARALLDWNARNPFCAGCGQPTLSVHGGGKRVCPSKDAAHMPGGAVGSTTAATPSTSRTDCVTRTGISNLSFPRTDPTVIMAVVSADGQRIMLGRQKRWPPYWYSTLAGFCEPAESIEEAVRREVWEEAGVTVGRVVIHSTQPWPFPANLMIGAIAQAIAGPGEKIDLGNDPELSDAKWYSFDEVREALRVGTSGLGEPAGPEYVEGGLRLPPRTAIANQLIEAVVGGFLGGNEKL